MRKYLPSAVDFEMLRQGILAFMDNPVDHFVHRPDDVKGICVVSFFP